MSQNLLTFSPWYGGRGLAKNRGLDAVPISEGRSQQIATWTYFRLSVVPESTLADLRRIGLSLLQLVSMRVYMDGGASLQRIVDDAQTLVKELNANVESFLQFDR